MSEFVKKNAILVGVQLPKVDPLEFQQSLSELERLVTTLGYHVVGQVTQKRKSDKSSLVLGSGKLKELAQWTGGTGEVAAVVERKLTNAALKWQKDEQVDDGGENFPEPTEGIGAHPSNLDVMNSDSAEAEEPTESDHAVHIENSQIGSAQIVIVDSDLSPSQIRNLESSAGVEVLDRTGVIIEIFSRHARTKTARLQVEIARLTYVAPRLRETGGGQDRQGGGVGGKGAGESSLELDRRKIRDRIKELKAELGSIGNEHAVRRARRDKEISVALVGYTNAGKSSLMRALTGSEVLVADKLFATLDTTIRPMHPESIPKILISDTVGFIKKLPHDLVASFKSTLDEALNCSLLLFVVDASDPSFRSQLEVTKTVLSEVGADAIPSLLVLNKQDRLNDDQKQNLKSEFPDAFFLSTRALSDVKQLREKIISYFETDMIEEDLFIPYPTVSSQALSTKGAVGEIRTTMKVLSESYSEKGIGLKVRAPQDAVFKLKKRYGL
jgi:GTPase